MIRFSVHMYLPHPTPINFQYILYTNKHHKLRHSKCGREKFGSGHRQNDGKQEDLLDLITALVKYNCLPTLIAQCRYESNG